MWKKNLLALYLFSALSFANAAEIASAPKHNHLIEEKIAQAKAQWQQTEQKITSQRTLFLQADGLLNLAKSQQKLPNQTQMLLERMIAELDGYPLQANLKTGLLKLRFELNLLNKAEQTEYLRANANSSEVNRWNQAHYDELFNAQDYVQLLSFAAKNPPISVQNQCQLFTAKYQLLAESTRSNNTSEHANQSDAPTAEPDTALEMATLLAEFGQFWAKGTAPSAFWAKGKEILVENDFPQSCQTVEKFWLEQGLKTAELVKIRALKLAEKGAQNGLANLTFEPLKDWLNEVQKLVKDPSYLQNFANFQPLAAENKALVIQAFPNFVKTLSETLPTPDFSPYQKWAEKFELNIDELNSWKASFISRLFDNPFESFQVWRDETLKNLKNDNLTERRLRMAIWQKTDLKGWLNLLSPTAQNKAEWRYWVAKVAADTERTKLWRELAKERGFYPMLAAQMLGINYQYPNIEPKKTIDEQQPQLAEIREYRALDDLMTAKTKWVTWLKTLTFDQQVALAHYANTQGWYDLGVEATILAKAWDYIEQRLPKAYVDWFTINLVDKPIKMSFAMAIARQESAWNPNVRSHANAIGLMQMLPSTAKTTADKSGLFYNGERDLLNPFRNIMLGTAHLSELNEKYPNNRILIAAAYNAGASRADKWLARANGKLAMDEFIASIPFLETRGYVQNVLTYDYYYQHILGQTPIMFSREELRNY